MRLSRQFGKTLREAPAEAEHDSHRLLLRAGLVLQIAAGIYTYLPLGWRVLRKIEQVVREEMDRIGGQEILMPVLSPAGLWAESGRIDKYGPSLFTLLDRRERTLVLGPTHEEVVVDLFRRTVQSHRELPRFLYQIQTKFRDEARPRMGLTRAREFGMMDLYSFHADLADLDHGYESVYQAYERVFARCGVEAIPVLADSGAIGGKDSQEFMLITDAGEDGLVLCRSCRYAANAERAESRRTPVPPEELRDVEEVSTPESKTIGELAGFLGEPAQRTLKAVFYMADGAPIFVAIRGDLEVNEVKLANALGAREIRSMSPDEVREHGLVAGSASPAGIDGVLIVADESAVETPNLIGGANRQGFHLRNLNYGRDWRAKVVADISLTRAGDPCIRCGMPLEVERGIEMGHIFKLGTAYTERMGARFLDASGHEQDALMGCYGIGTSRLLQCVIEANHDDRGIVWPAEVAPYSVHIVRLGLDRSDVAAKADALYERLSQAGLEVVYDDRDAAAGVKFNDADLIGVPIRITISPRSLAKDSIELKHRAYGEVQAVLYDHALDRVLELKTGRRSASPQ